MITTTQESHFKMQLKILDNENDKNWDKALNYVNRVIRIAQHNNDGDFNHYMRLIMASALSIGFKSVFCQHYETEHSIY